MDPLVSSPAAPGTLSEAAKQQKAGSILRSRLQQSLDLSHYDVTRR